jgi:hypothetical protein
MFPFYKPRFHTKRKLITINMSERKIKIRPKNEEPKNKIHEKLKYKES